MIHEEYKDLLALEALHSQDEAQASLLREHLAACDECRREQIEWRDAAALLAFSVDPVAPEALRARILDRLKETGAFSQAQTNGETNANSGAHRTKETGKVLPLRSRSNAGVEKVPFSKSALWPGALAASLVAALIISLVVLWQRNNAKQEEQARFSSRNVERQAEPNQSLPHDAETQAERPPSANNNDEAPSQINRLPNRNSPNRSDNNNRQDKKTGQQPQQPKVIAPAADQPQVTASPATESPVNKPAVSVAETQIVRLSGTKKAPQAHAQLVFDKIAGEMTVSVSELPPPAAGKAYQLWFIVKGHPIPGSVFVTGQQGQAMIHGQIPVRARGASAFAVTLEESNGANKPSGDKYLIGAITAS